MSIRRQNGGYPRVVFFGRRCRLSLSPLQTLLERGIDVRAVIVPGVERPDGMNRPLRILERPARRHLPLAGTPPRQSLDDVAHAAGIPIVEITTLRHPEVVHYLTTREPDILAISCFPLRLPPAVLAIPRLGALNLHPSLLPKHRGPDPLFWVYRSGERVTGVTVHLVTEEFDAGAIIVQEAFPLPMGTPGDQLEVQCADVGGRRLADAVMQMAQGTMELAPQAEAEASYESWPTDADLVLHSKWPVERAWHFARGVIPLGYHPLVQHGDDGVRAVRRVLGMHVTDNRAIPAQVGDQGSLVRFQDGSLAVDLLPSPVSAND